MRRATVGLMAALGLAAGAADARAGGEFAYDARVHIGILVIGGIAWIGSDAVLKDSFAPGQCHWCVSDDFDLDLRKELRWSDTEDAQALSNFLGFGVAPLSAFGLGAAAALADGRGREWPEDALIIAETTVVAADIDQLTKFATGRARPYTRDMTSTIAHSKEDNLSFYSGHTSLAFSLAAASGTVASIRRYRWAPLIWAVGMTTAAATGYLRVAADRHYATDVLVGAAMGSAIGVVLPLWLRPCGLGFSW